MEYIYIVRRHWLIRWLFVLFGRGQCKIVKSRTPPNEAAFNAFRYIGSVG
jgi:hypothetical protein